MARLLTRLLRCVIDRPLADEIVGDLVEERRRRSARSWLRGTLWMAGAAATLLCELAWDRLRSAPRIVRRTRPEWIEIAQAARSLRRTPAATLVIIATLAVGLGLNTATFSVVHGVLFAPLPFHDAEALVFVQGTRRDSAPSVFGTSYLDYQDLARAQTHFQALAASTYWTFTMTGTEVPLRLTGQRVTGSFFPLLGMPPQIGRWIDPHDDRAAGPEVVVLSHDLWQRVFGGDRSVVGRRVQLNGIPAEVIGVMPAAFRFPFEDVELWAAMLDEVETVPRQGRFFSTIGRLEPGADPKTAEHELLTIARDLERRHPETNRDWRPVLTPALASLTAEARPRLLLILAAVAVVLLVASVNVAALVVSRALGRRRELQLRVALGASRLRVARVLLLEATLVGIAGLAASILLAWPGVAVLKAMAPEAMPRLASITLSWRVLGWASAATALFVAIATLAPLVAGRFGRRLSLEAATVAGARRQWPRRAVIVGQLAFGFALLAAAGLLLRSFARVLDVHPGFTPDRLVTMRVFLTPPVYRTVDQQIDFVTRALEALRLAPEADAAGAISQPPFDTEGAGTGLNVAVEGRTYAPGTHPEVAYRAVSTEYFATAGLPLVDGRRFTADDRRGAPLVAVINRAMADTLWPGERAVGRRFQFADGRGGAALTVIGVVGDVATDGLETRERPAVYAPYVQRTLPFLRWMTIVVRTTGDPDASVAALRGRLQDVDPRQPIYAVTTMRATMRASMAARRFAVVLVGTFAGLTLLLSMIGVFGLLADRVGGRRREIGVRMALGAVPALVFRLVVAEGLLLLVAGVAAGAAVVAVATPLIRQALFGVTPTDPLTYAAIVAVMAVATLAACVAPALTAAGVDPAQTLRGGGE